MSYRPLFLSASVFIAALATLAVFVSAVTSTTGQFSAAPDVLRVNWTGAYAENVTLTNVSMTNYDLYVWNTPSPILNSAGVAASFSVNNGTAWNYTVNMTGAASRNVTLQFNTASLAAGRYTGNLTIANESISPAPENITGLAVVLDVPIAINTAGVGSFSGTVTNTTSELFFFNRSAITNAAVMRINLTSTSDGGLNFSWANDTTCNSYEGSAILNTSSSSTTFIPPYFPLTGFSCIQVSNSTTLTNINFSATVELLQTSLSAQVTSIANASNPSQFAVSPGQNITVNITALYQNGTAARNLNSSTTNFNITLYHKDNSSLSNTNLTRFTPTIYSVAADAYWNYSLTAGIPSTALGGNYTLYASVQDNNAGLNTTTAAVNYTVYDTALQLSPTSNSYTYCTGGNSSVSLGQELYCGYKVTNYGSKNATLVNVSRSVSGCSILDNYTNPMLLYTIAAWGGSNDTSTTLWHFNASTAGTCTITISTVATGTAWDRQNITINLNVSAPTTTTTNTSTGGGGGSESHVTNTTKELHFTAWPAETRVQQNASKTVSITVVNGGAVTLGDVSVSVSGIASTWWTSTPTTASMIKGASKTFSVTFNIPGDAASSNYSISYLASASGASASQAASLIVEPSPATQAQINATFANYTRRWTELSEDVNNTRATGANTSDAEAKLTTARGMLDSVSGYIVADDYFSANQLLTRVGTLLNDVETALKNLKQGALAGPAWMWWAIIGGAVAAVAAVIVVLARGKSPYGVDWNGMIDKIKEMFKKKEKKKD